MERQLNLVEESSTILEKRVLPRFPFNLLMFKENNCDKVFEICDISYTGMQLALKNGEHNKKIADEIVGNISWHGKTANVSAIVKWVKDERFGVAFTQKTLDTVRAFLSTDNLVAALRPMHEWSDSSNLLYWLRSDSSLELFIWGHKNSGYQKIILIMLDSFVEWEDGVGLKSGRIIRTRAIDTPLLPTGEFMCEVDRNIDVIKVNFAHEIISKISEELLPLNVIEFIKLKLGG